MPAYSDYAFKYGGSDYVLSFTFEYTNTQDVAISVTDFENTFSFTDLSGRNMVVAETIDQKSIETSFIIVSNETRVIHFITNAPENLQHSELNVEFCDQTFAATFDCKQNRIVPTALSIGNKETVSKHGEITLLDMYIDTSLYPANPGIYYRYYQADANKTYIIAEFQIKNLDSVAIHPNYLVTGIVRADGYEFEGFCAISVDDNSSIERTRLLDPLNETTAYFLAEIPDELKNANEISLSIRFYGHDYIVTMP